MNVGDVIKNQSTNNGNETGSEGPENFAEDSNNLPLPERPPRIQIRDMSFAMAERPEREWRVKDLLGAGHVGVLAAFTGSGKTWVCYDLAFCHALGIDWLGFTVVQGPVLIVNEEMDEDDLYKRLVMCNNAHYGDENTPVKTISFARFNLFSEKSAVKDAALLEAAIIETGAKLVIVDALSDIMVGGDENMVRDTQPVFMRLSDIAKHTRCAILVIHHTGWSGKTRGSSAIPGAVDLVIKAKKPPESDFMSFETEKQRVIKYRKWTAHLFWTPDQFYTELVGQTEKESKKLTPKNQAIINYLESCKDHQASTSEITEAVGVSRYMLINLQKDGYIRNIVDKSGSEAIYKLPDKPVDCG